MIIIYRKSIKWAIVKLCSYFMSLQFIEKSFYGVMSNYKKLIKDKFFDL